MFQAVHYRYQNMFFCACLDKQSKGMLVKQKLKWFSCGGSMGGHSYHKKLPTFGWKSTFPKTVLESWKSGHDGNSIKFLSLLHFAALVHKSCKSCTSLKSAFFFGLDHKGHQNIFWLHIFIERATAFIIPKQYLELSNSIWKLVINCDMCVRQ